MKNLCCNATLKQMVSCRCASMGIAVSSFLDACILNTQPVPKMVARHVVYRNKIPKTEPCLSNMTFDGWNLNYHHGRESPRYVPVAWLSKLSQILVYLPSSGGKSSENPKHFIVDCQSYDVLTVDQLRLQHSLFITFGHTILLRFLFSPDCPYMVCPARLYATH